MIDQFICQRHKPRWNSEPERSGSLEIDHEFKSGRLKNGQVGRLRAFQDLSDVSAAVPVAQRRPDLCRALSALNALDTLLVVVELRHRLQLVLGRIEHGVIGIVAATRFLRLARSARRGRRI